MVECDIQEKMSSTQKEIYCKYMDNFPFKIIEFINELGIKVTAAKMDSSFSGAICNEEGEYRIYINDSHSPTRLRFTLAHELGHYFYDRPYLDSNAEITEPSKQAIRPVLFRKDGPDIDPEMRKMDINANQFAAQLLMPEIKFIEIWNQKTTPEQVADFFGVSVEAVKIRASVLLGEIF